MTPLKIIEEGLRGSALPPLTRPGVGPDDDPTEELVRWGTAMYVYSSVAHMRAILAGLVVLTDIGNTSTADVVCRHVFEWAAQACFMKRNLTQHFANNDWRLAFGLQKQVKREPPVVICFMKRNLTQHFANNDWRLAFDLLLKADGGNRWIRNHGHKYDALPLPDDRRMPVRVNKLIDAYDEYHAEEYGEGDAKDAYGFLSEHSHASGACFLQYREISGAEVRFISPAESCCLPSANRSLIEWVVFMHGLLGLATETAERGELLGILSRVAKSAGTRAGDW